MSCDSITMMRQRASSLLARPGFWRGQYTPFLNQRTRVASGGTGADCGLTVAGRLAFSRRKYRNHGSLCLVRISLVAWVITSRFDTLNDHIN